MLILFNSNTPIYSFENNNFQKIILINESDKYEIKKIDENRIVINSDNSIQTLNSIFLYFLKTVQFNYITYKQIESEAEIKEIKNKKTNFIELKNSFLNFCLDKQYLSILQGFDVFSNVEVKAEKIKIENSEEMQTLLLKNQKIADCYFALKILILSEFKSLFELKEIDILGLEEIKQEIEKNRKSLNLNVFDQNNENVKIKDFNFSFYNSSAKKHIFSNEIFMFLNVLHHRKYFFDSIAKIKKIIDFSISEIELADFKIKNALKSYLQTILNVNNNFIIENHPTYNYEKIFFN